MNEIEILGNINQAAKDWNDSKLSKENREKAKEEWYLLVKKFHEIYRNSPPGERPNLRST
jgi:hypothetical protein